MGVMSNFAKEKISKQLVSKEIETQKELARRKLDFELIRDNYRNKATKEILDKFVVGQTKG